jgi:L-ribulose-5-phosphate 4-epimerase
MLEKLKKEVLSANLELVKQNLVIFTWGNVSGIDRDKRIVAIKPSGVPYEKLQCKDIVLVDLEGHVIEGSLRPSSDTPTHLELYKNFKEISGVCHTHSKFATIWAQINKAIPCLGTTHADYFYGEIPVTEKLSAKEFENYEESIGKSIVEKFKNINPLNVPGALVSDHGPFTWGETPLKSVENAAVLEYIAELAFFCELSKAQGQEIDINLLDKHFFRKHGKDAYYGQSKNI